MQSSSSLASRSSSFRWRSPGPLNRVPPINLPFTRRAASVGVWCEKCLIVNTKGGGHAFVGLHLARQLLSAGHKVALMNDGDKEKLANKAPFSEYPALEQEGAKVVWANPMDPATYPSTDFDVVYDNNGKTPEVCRPLIDAFKGCVAHHVFISSAGAYVANGMEPMHVEGGERKESAGHYGVEKYLKETGIPYTIFQPLYIYGPYSAKDCEQWFIDRIIRDRPLPIPEPGIQLTSLTHVEDIASMLATVPGNEKVVKQEYNICSDRCITFEGIVEAIAKALGKEAKLVKYDPTVLGLKKGEGFPFRAVHFFASSDKAKRELGWRPAHDFMKDVKSLCDAYISSGRQNRDINFSIDDRILAAIS